MYSLKQFNYFQRKAQKIINLINKLNKIIIFAGVETPPSNDSVRFEPGPFVNGAGALYVAATCACALILVVGSVASALYIRNSKARVQESQ